MDGNRDWGHFPPAPFMSDSGLEVTALSCRSFNGQSSPVSISHQALEPPPVFSRLDLGMETLFYFCEYWCFPIPLRTLLTL